MVTKGNFVVALFKIYDTWEAKYLLCHTRGTPYAPTFQNTPKMMVPLFKEKVIVYRIHGICNIFLSSIHVTITSLVM